MYMNLKTHKVHVNIAFGENISHQKNSEQTAYCGYEILSYIYACKLVHYSCV